MGAMPEARAMWAVLAVLGGLCGPAAAAEQGDGKLPTPVVIVVDIQAAQRDSAAAKAARVQRDQYLQKYQSELENGRVALKQTEDELGRQRAVLTPDAWQLKVREFEQRVAEFNRRNQGLLQAVDKSYRTVMNEMMAVLIRVTEEVATEYGANLVMQKQQVLLHDPRMEVTNLVIERLNKKLPTVVFPTPEIEGDTPPAPPPGPKSSPKAKK